MFRLWSSVLCFCLLTFSPACGQEWTRFRGPNGTGISAETKLPTTITAANVLWTRELPAAGHSCPVIWGDRLFLTGAENEKTAQRFAFAVNIHDGQILWTQKFDSEFHKKHEFNSFATPTPVVDAERVYLVWSTPQALTVTALDHSGKTVWQRHLGPYVTQHSSGSSPILFENLLILTGEQDEILKGESYLIGLDTRTGETRWKIPRKSKWNPYSTPCLFDPEGSGPQIIFCSIPHGITAADPRTGGTLWELTDVLDKRPVASPVILQNKWIGAMCGFGTGGTSLTVVEPPQVFGSAPQSGLKTPRLVYRLDKQVPYVPTPVVLGKHFYFWGDNGIVSCHEVQTGKSLWRERVGGNYFASPVSAGGALYGVSTTGELVVLAASEKYRLISRHELGHVCHSTPAIAAGKLFVRTFGHLFAIGEQR